MTPYTDVPSENETAVMVGINVDPSAELTEDALEVKIASVRNNTVSSITMSAHLALFVAKQITDAAMFILEEIEREKDNDDDPNDRPQDT